MLRRVLDGEKRNWDRSFLMFFLATGKFHRQLYIGFNPFELYCMEEIRGPLDVLKEEWIDNPNTETDILSYILQVRDRLETSREIMEQNAKIAQKKQKEYYDQRAKKTKLDPGDKVLLLLSSSTKKFLAQWQGPYSVTRRVGKVNYEIVMPDNGGRSKFFMSTI